MIKLTKILVPTDFSESSKAALPYAIDLARKYEAKIVIFHVFDEELISPIFFETGVTAQDYFQRIQEHFEAAVNEFLEDIDIQGLEVEAQLGNGKPFVEIIKFARENGIDLIVMATHGRSGLSHAFLGSVTEKVIRKSFCPVLIVRRPDFEFKMP